MSKGKALRKETIKEKNLEFTRKKEYGMLKYRLNTIDLPSPLEFSKMYLRMEAKIITLSHVILNVGRGNF